MDITKSIVNIDIVLPFMLSRNHPSWSRHL